MYGKLLDDSGAIQVCGKDIVVRNLDLGAGRLYAWGKTEHWTTGSWAVAQLRRKAESWRPAPSMISDLDSSAPCVTERLPWFF
jgi:hypothetical protein